MPPSDVRVILLHGTFAGADNESGSAWWQNSGALRQRLARNHRVEAFQWDIGPNSESARRQHAAILCEHIVALESEGARYAFVAHSHGGSLLWHALSMAQEKVAGLPNLHRWITVGTPFLYGAPDWPAVLWVVPLAVSLLGLAEFLLKHARNYWLLRYDFALSFEPWLHGPILFVLTMLALTTLLTSTFVARALANALQEKRLSARRTRAYVALGSRHRVLAACDDEAIAALSLTLAFDGVVLPGSGVLAPLSRLLDRLLWRRASRAAQGCDISGVAITRVSASPVESPVTNYLPEHCNLALDACAAQYFGATSTQLRRSLRHAVFSEPVRQIGDLLDKVDVTDGLIHTSYFRDDATMQAVQDLLVGEPCSAGHTATGRIARGADGTLRGSLALGLALVLFVAIRGLGNLLEPLDIHEMVLRDIPESAFGDAASADATESFEIFRSLAAVGRRERGDRAAAELQSGLDRAMASAYAVAGTEESGDPAWVEPLLRSSWAVAEARARPGFLGPTATENYFDLATVRLLGRAGRWDEAMLWLQKRAPSGYLDAMAGSWRHFGFGLAERNREELLPGWLSQSKQSDQEAVWERWMSQQVDCGRLHHGIAQILVESREWAYAEGAVNWSRCQSPALTVRQQPRAVHRLRAAARLALRPNAAEDELRLLLSVIQEFENLPKRPLDDVATALSLAAEALVRWNRLDDARDLLRRVERLPVQSMNGSTYIDTSPPNRALVWARLGDTEEALRMWTRAHAQIDAFKDDGEAYALLERLVAAGARSISVEKATGANPTESQRAHAAVRIDLGLIGNLSPLAAGRRLLADAHTARKIYEPRDRSYLIRDVAMAMLDHGLPRSAINAARRCTVNDRLYVLAAVLRWRPGERAHRFEPFLRPDE